MPQAIACFLAQDYLKKELILVGDSVILADFVPRNDRCIRTIPLIDILGAKRNAACDNARGEIICHFDDDDYSAPGRLTDQVAILRAGRKALTGYHTIVCREFRDVRVLGDGDESWRQTSGWWRWHFSDGYPAGNSFCYRRDWWAAHPFPPVGIGEDNVFCSEAFLHDQVVASDGSRFLCASNHHGCTSDRSICGPDWTELPGPPPEFAGAM